MRERKEVRICCVGFASILPLTVPLFWIPDEFFLNPERLHNSS